MPQNNQCASCQYVELCATFLPKLTITFYSLTEVSQQKQSINEIDGYFWAIIFVKSKINFKIL